MANNIQVSLSFTADASKAKAELQDLQRSLQQLGTGSSTTQKGLGLTQDILKAQEAVRELSVALKNATNIDTGKLNLTQFQTQLNAMGGSLSKYREEMSKLGTDGQKAFLSLTKQIVQADVAIKGSSKLMNDLWITLKNTAKWQLSSSAMKAFMGAVQSAFHYAEDLNKSLNQIQIVTNKSSADMANFAVQANKAAKELSTTTTAYTDASLIYYQQGLGEQAVKERTDITIKAANAAGTSAEKMSDYLTAVWNSYKVGSDQLEHFVDIMAALGAGTATSLEEISTAMEKVASVGESTGVSFEQLSSIIATVSSVTRASAETVGTSFKTIFARMGDLALEGSVLEDGVTTTLGKVSGQLAQVGVNILNEKGELRDMGTVMEELMSKWNGMNEATQQAVAIAVAGKRQYTQLLALMNNQDMYKDAMKMATNADGTLQQQADIYAQSWEAAQKRVKAAAEGIYDSLINDKFFIALNDGFAGFLGFLEKVIDSLGGFKGVLSAIGVVLTQIFEKQMSSSFANLAQSLFSTTALARQRAAEMKQLALEQAQILTNKMASEGVNREATILSQVTDERLKLYEQFYLKYEKMSDIERQLYQARLDSNQALAEAAILAAKERDIAEQKKNTLLEELKIQSDIDASRQASLTKELENIANLKYYDFNSLTVGNKAFSITPESWAGDMDYWISELEKGQNLTQEELDLIQKIKDIRAEIVAEQGKSNITNEEAVNKFKISLLGALEGTNKQEQSLKRLSAAYGISEDKLRQLLQAFLDEKQAQQQSEDALNRYNESLNSFKTNLSSARERFSEFGQGMTKFLQSTSQIAMGLSSLHGAFNALNNENMSFFEKVTSIMMSLSMGIPALISGFSSFGSSISLVAGSIRGFTSANAAAILTQSMLNEENAKAVAFMGVEIPLKQMEDNIDKASIGTKLALLAARKLGIQAVIDENGQLVINSALETKNAAVKKILSALISALTAVKLLKTKATVAETVANEAETASEEAETGAIVAQTTAEEALVVVQNGLVVSTGALVAAIGALLAVIGIVVFVVMAIVAAYQKWKDSTPEAQVKHLTEASKSFAEAAEKATEKVNDLKNALDGLEKYEETIKGLEKGTREWTQAISEHNQEMLQLIDKYPELKKAMSYDSESGIFNIDKGAIQNAMDRAQREANMDQLMSVYFSNAASKKNAEIDNENALKSFDNSREYKLNNASSPNMPMTLPSDIDNLQSNRFNSNMSLDDIKKELIENYKYVYNGVARSTGDKEINDLNELPRKEGVADLFKEIEQTSKRIYDNFQTVNTSIESSLVSGMTDNLKAEKNIRSDRILDNEKYNKTLQDEMKPILEGKQSATKEDRDQYIKNKYGDAGFEFKGNDKIVDSLGNEIEKDINDKKILITNLGFKIEDEARQDLENEINKVTGEIEKKIGDNFKISNEALKGELTDLTYSLQESLDSMDNVEFNKDNLDKGLTVIQDWAAQLQTAGKQGRELEEGLSKINVAYRDIDWSEGISEVKDFENSLKELGVTLTDTERDALKLQASQAQQKAILAETAEYMRTYEGNIKKQAEALGLSEKSLENYKKQLEETNKVSNISNETLLENAVVQKRVSSMLNSLSKDWDKLYKSLTNAEGKIDPFAEGYEEALGKLREATEGLVGAKLSEDFFLDPEHLKDIERAINGDTDALSRLRAAAVDDIVMHLSYDFEPNDELFLKLQSNIDAIQAELDANKFKFGAEIDSAAFDDLANTMNEMVRNGQMTAEEFMGIWDGLGIQPEIEEVDMNADATANATGKSSNTITTKGSITIFEGGDDENTPRKSVSTQQYEKTETITSDTSADADDSTGGTMPQVKFSATDGNGKGTGAKGKRISKPSAKAGSSTRTSASSGGTSSGGKGGKSGGSSGGGGRPTSSKSSSGGGGSPSTSTQETKTPTKAEPKTADQKIMRAEAERYLDISAALKRVKEYQDDLARSKEHLFGVNYVNKLEEETAALQEEARVLEDYNNQILLNNKRKEDGTWELNSKGQESDAAKLERITGIKLELDDNGSIKNRQAYADWFIQKQKDIEQGKVNDENSIEDSWYDTQVAAGGEASDAQKEEYEKSKTTSEKYWEQETDSMEQAQEALDKYVADNEKYIENQNRLEEILYETRSKNLEKITYKLERQIELNEYELKLFELQEKILRKNTLENSPEIFTSLMQQTTNATNALAHYEDALHEIMNNPDLNDDERAEKIKELGENIIEETNTLLEMQDKVKDYIGEIIEAWTDKLDVLNEKFEHFTGVLEQYEKLYEITGKDMDYSTMEQLMDVQTANAENKLKSAENTYQTALDAYNEAVKKSNHSDFYDKEYLEELWKTAAEAKESMLEARVEYGELLKKARDLRLEEAGKTLKKKALDSIADALGLSSIDMISDRIEHLSSMNDLYLTETNQKYETQKLIRQAMLDIDKTENQAAKNRLRLFQQETEAMQKQEKLSKYELERKQKEYQLLLAEIAMQEAQNAKDTVRLQRDSEGNFNYVYTADENKIAESLQAYEDAQNDLYNFDLENANAKTEALVNLAQEATDKIIEIWSQEGVDEVEKRRQTKDYLKQIEDEYGAYLDIAGLAAMNLSEKVSDAYMADVLEEIDSTEDFADALEEFSDDAQTAFSDFASATKSLTKDITSDLQNITTDSGKTKNAVIELNNTSRAAFSEMTTNISKWSGTAIDQLNQVINHYKQLAESIKEVYQIQSGYDNGVNYMARFQQSTTISAAKSNLQARAEKLLDPKYAALYDENVKELQKEINNEHQQMKDSSTLAGVLAAAARRVAKIDVLEQAGVYLDVPNTADILFDELARLGVSADVLQYVTGMKQAGTKTYTEEDEDQLYKLLGLSKFDTGGFTGDFGSAGKLAILHEKELVLNQEDTNNVLKSVEIANTIVEKVMGENLRFSLNTALGNSIIKNNDQSQIVRQTVSIEASFPNVQDRNEIQLALENIVNTAAQYANRKSY